MLAELRKCGLTDNENCLKAVTDDVWREAEQCHEPAGSGRETEAQRCLVFIQAGGAQGRGGVLEQEFLPEGGGLSPRLGSSDLGVPHA